MLMHGPVSLDVTQMLKQARRARQPKASLPPKDKPLNTKVDQQTLDLITQAAQLAGLAPSTYVRRAAREAALKDIREITGKVPTL